MRLTIYGASDDLIEVDGDISEEYSVPSEQRGTFTLVKPGDRLAIDGVRIHVVLEDSGCWSVGVSPIDEDSVVPTGWEFRVDPQGRTPATVRYSSVLHVVADDDAVLAWEEGRR